MKSIKSLLLCGILAVSTPILSEQSNVEENNIDNQAVEKIIDKKIKKIAQTIWHLTLMVGGFYTLPPFGSIKRIVQKNPFSDTVPLYTQFKLVVKIAAFGYGAYRLIKDNGGIKRVFSYLETPETNESEQTN